MQLRKYIYIAVSALPVLTGCKKFLEHAPDMRTELDSPDKVAELLTSAYPQADYITFAESASDNAEDKGAGIGSEDIRYTNPYYWEDVENRAQGSVDFYWNASYEAIAAANQALKVAEEHSNEPAYLPFKGEALLARAYAYFMLVNLYAQVYVPGSANNSPGIPYVTEPETVVITQYSRGTVASVYAQIENDITEGLPLIRNSAYKVQKYHFNIAAAHALAARFYLFKGEYEKVIEHVTAIYPGGDFVSNLRPWTTRYRNYTDSEMLVNFTKATENSTLLLIETESLWARTRTARYGFGQKLNNELFLTNNVTGKQWGHRIWSYGVPHYNFLKWNEYFHRVSPNATTGYPYTIIPVLTVDEALMNRAEAYAVTGQFDLAIADLNAFASTRIIGYNAATDAVTLQKVSAYYNEPDPEIGLVKTVLDWKRAEFLTEGLRWFDIIRHRLPVRHNIIDINGRETFIDLATDDPRRVFQIPQEAVLSGVELNPR